MHRQTKDGYFSSSGTRGALIVQALAALLISVSPDLESMKMAPTFANYTGFYWPEGRKKGKVQPVLFPLYEMFRRTNADPSDKPYLRNISRIYFVNSLVFG